jgi:hypothetical protein
VPPAPAGRIGPSSFSTPRAGPPRRRYSTRRCCALGPMPSPPSNSALTPRRNPMSDCARPCGQCPPGNSLDRWRARTIDRAACGERVRVWSGHAGYLAQTACPAQSGERCCADLRRIGSSPTTRWHRVPWPQRWRPGECGAICRIPFQWSSSRALPSTILTCSRSQSSAPLRAIIGVFLLGFGDSIFRVVLTFFATQSATACPCAQSSAVCSHSVQLSKARKPSFSCLTPEPVFSG